jgi:hypothetical protein
MPALDLKKELAFLYNPPAKRFTVVEVPAMNFLMIDGHGDPNTSPDYQAALETLYGMAYGIKFALKPQGIEYVVPPPEGLWWMEDMTQFSQATKDRWDWTMMIMQPDPVTPEIVEQVRAEVARKKPLPALPKLRFERYHEGLSVQIMYLGAYADEGPTIAAMHEFIHAEGYEPNGKHHEIYLGDPRRTAPQKLKTVIRQPVRKVSP